MTVKEDQAILRTIVPARGLGREASSGYPSKKHVSGWWLLPAFVLGALMWAVLLKVLF